MTKKQLSKLQLPDIKRIMTSPNPLTIEELDWWMTHTNPPKHYILDSHIDHVFYSIDKSTGNHVTVVKWKDGHTTTVTCDAEDHFDKFAGLAFCLVKDLFGNNGRFNDELVHQVDKSTDYTVNEA